MTEEEKKAITYVKKDLEKAITLELQIVNTDRFSVETILNLINKKQKEIEKKDKIIDLALDKLIEGTDCYFSEFDYMNKEEIKQYFENEVEGE